MEEFWKDINGYENLYQVSNFGNVVSLGNHTIKNQYSGKKIYLKYKIDKYGYYAVTIRKNGIPKTTTVHRLVAQAFISNPNNLPCINHKDENKTNNRVDNLEWCTIKYNNNYGTHYDRMAEAKSKMVFQYSLNGEFIKSYKNSIIASKSTGIGKNGIRRCARGERNKCGGYKWKYEKQKENQ